MNAIETDGGAGTHNSATMKDGWKRDGDGKPRGAFVGVLSELARDNKSEEGTPQTELKSLSLAVYHIYRVLNKTSMTSRN
jgi:hypothetical protein